MSRRIAVVISLVAFNLMACCCGGVPPAKQPSVQAKAEPDQEPPAPTPAPLKIAASEPKKAITIKPVEKKASEAGPSISPKKVHDDLEAVARSIALSREGAEKYARETNAANAAEFEKKAAKAKVDFDAKVERYSVLKKKYDIDIREYRLTVSERDAAAKLNLTINLIGNNQVSEVAAKRLVALINEFPRTTAAKEAQTLLDGGNVQVRKLPVLPDMPIYPTMPSLRLPSRPVILLPHYAADDNPGLSPLDVAMARAKAVEDAKKKRIQEEEAAKANIARLKAIEDAKPRGVNRAAYNTVKIGMNLKDVQAILGPGKEVSRTNYHLIVSWQSSAGAFERATVISMTFDAGGVVSKTIIGP